MSRTLDILPRGTRAWVVAVGGEPGVADRLIELGFGEGVEVEALHAGPIGGDPIAVQVGGAVIALRRAQARLIRVEPLAASLAEAAE